MNDFLFLRHCTISDVKIISLNNQRIKNVVSLTTFADIVSSIILRIYINCRIYVTSDYKPTNCVYKHVRISGFSPLLALNHWGNINFAKPVIGLEINLYFPNANSTFYSRPNTSYIGELYVNKQLKNFYKDESNLMWIVCNQYYWAKQDYKL